MTDPIDPSDLFNDPQPPHAMLASSGVDPDKTRVAAEAISARL